MSLPAGTRLGPYEVVSVLGAGGMGEVYRGLDTRLERPVAIKCAKGPFTDRFLREARAVSALNHPHICTLYDVGPDYLVMELVEGETLAARLARSRLTLDEVHRIGAQIAEALAAAHAKNIVHRDLKPANVMLTRGGAKLLDFGVAKVMGPHAETALTTQGIVGTPAYMAPEQLSGSDVDHRADIFALGLLLREMATGQRVPVGQVDALALSALPERLAHVIELCLARQPEDRWQSASDVRLELEWCARNTTVSAAAATTSPRRRGALTLGIAGLVGLSAVAGALVSRWSAGTPEVAQRSAVRTTIALPPGLRLDSSVPLALSPDGTQLAFVGVDSKGDRQLYLRSLASPDARALPGTSGAMHPFFSPDGKSLGFFNDGTLLRVDLDGGSPIRLSPLPGGADAGGAWGGNDTIVVAVRGQGLFKVHASGGSLERVGQVRGARFPSFLPDGATVLYASLGPDGRTVGFAIVRVDGTGQRDIARISDVSGSGAPVLGAIAEPSQASLLPSGLLVFGTDPGVVRALPVDVQTLEPRGAAVTLGDPIERGANAGGIAFAVSRTGLLVFAGTGNEHELVWVTRQGHVTPLQIERAAFRHPTLSPDERTIAVSINDETRTPHAWLVDVARGARTQVAKQAINLVWSRDGQRVAYGNGGLFAAPVDGSAVDTLAGNDAIAAKIKEGTAPYPTSWSGDGRTLLFQADNEQICKLSVDERRLEQLLDAPGREFEAQVSPDSRAVAYTSTQSGRAEILVATWPGLQNRRVISTSGGVTPRWSRDSREVFYWQGQTLMSARVSPSIDVSVPVALFSGPFFGAARVRAFDVAADGRFLMVRADARAELREITLVQDWARDRTAPR